MASLLSAAKDSGPVADSVPNNPEFKGDEDEATAAAAAAAASDAVAADAAATFNAARRRSSASARNNATATMRLSISDAVNIYKKEQRRATEEEHTRRESSEKIRRERRASSLSQMGVANVAIREAVSSILQQKAGIAEVFSGATGPVQKLQELLTRAKERGISAERLFEHFAPNGETLVTPEMFEAGLRKLDHRGTFELDELEIDHLLSTFNSDGSGTIELDNFMTFCLSIPSLPWRAEKVRRLSNTESEDGLNVAARKIARRRSSLRAIPIGKLLHQGSLFFWRSKESIDVAYHHNADEGLITISTRCPERGYNYPAIFVDASKIPISRADAVKRVNPIGQLNALAGQERQDEIDKALADLRVEYLEHRLKVPDDVNEPRGENALWTSPRGASAESSPGEDNGRGWSRKPMKQSQTPPLRIDNKMLAGFGGVTPRERAEDKARHRPFLVKLSTDKWDTILSGRNVVLQTPYRFSTPGRRPSMEDFRRTSIKFEELAKETGKLSTEAKRTAQKLGASIDRISAAAGKMASQLQK